MLLRLNSAGTTWTTLAPRTGNLADAVAPRHGSPTAGRLIHYDGDWGGREYNPATNTWTQRWAGNGADGSGLPQFTGNPYNVVSLYSARCRCVILAGGTNFRKMNSDGSFTVLTQSGGPGSSDLLIGPNASSFVVEPVTGVLLVITSGTMRVFDPGTTNSFAGSWSTGTNIPAFFNNGADGTSESLISAPISTYGVVMYVKHDDAGTGRVFLYKHSPSQPSPPPMSPSELTAR